MKLHEMIFDEKGPKISAVQLEAAEQRLQVHLPNDYRDFLLLHNGGWAKRAESSDREIQMYHWLSVTSKDKLPIVSLVKANERVRDKSWKDFILIGFDIADHHLVMCVDGECRGRVGIFNWEIGDPVAATALPFRSFTDFLDQLSHVEEPE